MNRLEKFFRAGAVACVVFVGLLGSVHSQELVLPGEELDSGRSEEKDGVVLEGEDNGAKGAANYRDKRASGEKCAGRILVEKMRPVVAGRAELPAGEYVAVFRLEAAPADIVHFLQVSLRAGSSLRTLQQIHFDPEEGYQEFELAFSHAGGTLPVRVSAKGGSGFDGMRSKLSEKEKKEYGSKLLKSEVLREEEEDATSLALDELEEAKSVDSFKPYDHRLLCDAIELRPVRHAQAIVQSVTVDKVHYRPGETIGAEVAVYGATPDGKYELVAEDITEIDSRRRVWSRNVELGRGTTRKMQFDFQIGQRVFGHELRCTLQKDGAPIHGGSAFYGASRNVYRVGICGDGGPQNVQNLTEERAAEIMERNKRRYANYFERFAWAPCDYSNLAPETQKFWSGQTQYPGSITGYQTLIQAAHDNGVKAITYGKSCAAGIEGFKTFQRHPEYFQHRPEGPGTQQFNVFYLERMLANDYNLHAKPIDGGWQHWASLWTNWGNDETVRFGAQAIMDSIEMFGWDGVRWDGHFRGKQQIFIDILRENYPDFVHGYNIAFGNPKGNIFVPRRDMDDFHTVAAEHGLMMDESVRDWSHTNFSPGHMRPFYEALCREADYIKRIGGLPLFITFDMASPQDRTFNVLCGLAAGERYCYLTSPGEFAFGPLPKFLTRYSAFIWDDTQRVANPGDRISVKVGEGPEGAEPWWRKSTWLRDAPSGKKQVLINLLNPPGYPQFCNRVQTPPATLRDITIRVKSGEGTKLTRAAHISPDLVEGHHQLETQRRDGSHVVTVPRLRTWSIVILEYDADAEPEFPVTTPVKDAREYLEKRREKRKTKTAKKPEKKKKVPYYRDYERHENVDAKRAEKMERPEEIVLRRNGELDVHHARGAFSWLNPVGSAVGLLGGGRYDPSWVDYVGFKLNRTRGCMDEFPDSYERLLAYDVVVLDDVHSFYLGSTRRVKVADFVRNGGGLVYFGGYFNLSLGADHNTFIEEILPVRIKNYADIQRDDKGLPLRPVDKTFFEGMVDWSKPPVTFVVDTSDIDDRARVLVRAGRHPAIVASRYGEGRVVTMLINPHGGRPEDVTPYWEWPQWPRVLSACVRWAAEGWQEEDKTGGKKRTADKSKPQPMDLMMEAFDLDSAAFTKKVKQARVNVVDAESAKVMLETAVGSVDKIEDLDLLKQIVDDAAPYFNKDFAPLGKKLISSEHWFIREAGYQILGRAGDPEYRELLEKGLQDGEPRVVRQALVGLGRLGVAESRPALRRYLKSGSEKLLAAAALKRSGSEQIIERGLELYGKEMTHKIHLKCGRRSLESTLWGGVSFKLTREQRKKLMAEYRELRRVERQVKFDINFFEESLTSLSEGEMQNLVEFMTETEKREVLPFAYEFFANLPDQKAEKYVPQLEDARLDELRMLAEF